MLYIYLPANMAAAALRAMLLLTSISQFNCGNNNVTTGVVKPEILELVNVIKQDLRKNNDDYADALQQKGAPRASSIKPPDRAPARGPKPATLGGHKKSYERKRLKLEETRRRAYGPIADVEMLPRYDPSEGLSEMPRPDQPRGQVVQRAAAAARLRDPQLYLQNPHLQKQFPKKYNGNEMERKAGKMDKLQLFMEKNRGTLQQYAKLKRERGEGGGGGAHARARIDTSSETVSDHDPELKLPTADQLDMAPAQGGRIHVMRIKGRLCQRNVLIPEGPKYDSYGKIYLPAHEPSKTYNRQYHQTKSPPYLLPRCCNCCKKSVLGCE